MKKIFILSLFFLSGCDSIPHRSREFEDKNFKILASARQSFSKCIGGKSGIILQFDFLVFKKFQWFEPVVKGNVKDETVKGKPSITILSKNKDLDLFSTRLSCLKSELMNLEFIIRDSRLTYERFIYDLEI